MAHSKVLIVEDDPKSLYAFKSVLQARGFDIVATASAEDALACDVSDCDTALIDVRLPKMQGTDLALHLREKHPSLRIVFVTAYNGVDKIQERVARSAVMLKPVDIDSLLRLL